MTAEYISGEGSQYQLAQKYGIPRRTATDIVKNPAVVAAAQPFLKRFEAKLETLAEKLVDRYVEIAEQADFTDKSTTALGIITDKLLLLKGQATQITETRQSIGPETLAVLRQIVERRREEGMADTEIQAALLASFPEAEPCIKEVMICEPNPEQATDTTV